MTLPRLSVPPDPPESPSRRGRRRALEPHDRLSVWLPTRSIDHLMSVATKHRMSVSRLVKIVVLQLEAPDRD